MTKAEKYIRYLIPLFGTNRTKEILNINPVTNLSRKDADQVFIGVYDYDAYSLRECTLQSVEESFSFKENNRVSWINIDGLTKRDVDAISEKYGIHMLIAEDILSVGQRPKMDEVEGILYCLLNMLYYDQVTQTVEQEQVSIVLGQGFVITFQEDPHRDVFNPIRDKLKIANSKLRQRGADYLCYAMI
ncbi:MAG TPA: CorA family divalent cation transporter, partial [Flavisolibacter sp.]|nr:CorA family divalent cation transporter [Flavisolibacter sp.]